MMIEAAAASEAIGTSTLPRPSRPAAAGVDAPADRADESEKIASRLEQAEDDQADRQRVDAMVGQLLGELVAPGGTGLDTGFGALLRARGDLD